MKRIVLVMLFFSFACSQPVEQKNEFLEIRINRWTALEGGETLVLRRINKDWSSILIGDGGRFSCYYQKNIQPKSGYDNFWNELQREGLLEISEGRYDAGWTDGNGFVVEINYQNKLKRFSFRIPEELKTDDAKRILNIGDLISQEFDTPVFVSHYNRGTVGDYLIENCKDLKK